MSPPSLPSLPSPSTPVDPGLAARRPERIAGMFDAIARRYDLLNHLLSAGLDRRWRARAVDALDLAPQDRLLDLCTGTADLAIEALRPARTRQGAPRVVGLDFAGEMLRVASRKLDEARLRVPLVRGDAVRLPLSSEAVDAVTVGFGIRNVVNRLDACREAHRVLRPGGRFAVLEFSMPSVPAIRGVYLWYFTRVLPRIGAIVARHSQAYSYLPESVGAFPSPEAFAGELRSAGFREVSATRLSLGVVYLYMARKAATPGRDDGPARPDDGRAGAIIR